ncbi:MAG: adenylate kinase family protein [Candidatus Aenigmarchaeota archaeon]|nr:adenylate kinase family protein [Candidatus Aenigmarchaeota archaeon]
MKLAITGTPSTGKTVISKKLAERLGWKLISVNDLAEKLNAYLGEDKKRRVKILDMKKIKDYLEGVEGNVVIEGHAAHEVPCDIVIVLRCDPEVLEKRLKERYPCNPEKVKENVDAEILGVITSEAVECNEKVYEVDTTKKAIDQNVDDIVEIINSNTENYEVGLIDWLEEYEERLV